MDEEIKKLHDFLLGEHEEEWGYDYGWISQRGAMLMFYCSNLKQEKTFNDLTDSEVSFYHLIAKNFAKEMIRYYQTYLEFGDESQSES